MSEGDWLRATAPTERPGPPVSRVAQRVELRPLSLGEVLDRSFALYRARFALFAGISMIAAAVYTLGLAVSLVALHRLAHVQPVPGVAGLGAVLSNLRETVPAQLGSYAVMLVFFLVSAVTQAATVLAVTHVYLGQATDARGALRSVAPHWLRYIGIALWQGVSLLWIPLAAAIPAFFLLLFAARTNATGLIAIGGLLFVLAIFAGFPVGLILYLRNALAVPASVSEGLPVREAMRRSKALAAGTKGRLFVVLLIAGVLLEVVGVLQLPLNFLMLAAPNQQHYLAMGTSLLLSFAGHTLVAPVACLGFTLLYFDQRVRKEAFDLQLLLDGARATVPGTVPGPEHLETHDG